MKQQTKLFTFHKLLTFSMIKTSVKNKNKNTTFKNIGRKDN